jgi:hypothetical protein
MYSAHSIWFSFFVFTVKHLTCYFYQFILSFTKQSTKEEKDEEISEFAAEQILDFVKKRSHLIFTMQQ